jgi:hypothetical protein
VLLRHPPQHLSSSPHPAGLAFSRRGHLPRPCVRPHRHRPRLTRAHAMPISSTPPRLRPGSCLIHTSVRVRHPMRPAAYLQIRHPVSSPPSAQLVRAGSAPPSVLHRRPIVLVLIVPAVILLVQHAPRLALPCRPLLWSYCALPCRRCESSASIRVCVCVCGMCVCSVRVCVVYTCVSVLTRF